MKYMGGKGKIANILCPIMLENYNGNCFVDIFCGGCSIIERIPDTYRRIANDKQKYYKAQARIAFRKYVGKELPNEICSMWY